MALFAIAALDVPADPFAVARALSDAPGLALLHAAGDGAQPSFVAADPVEVCTSWLPPMAAASTEANDTRGGVPRWIGVIPYECARSLERVRWTRSPDERAPPQFAEPRWHRYAAVVEVDAARGQVRVVGDHERSVLALARRITSAARRASRDAPPSAELRRLPDDDPPEAHLARVREAQRLIGAGDLYQVNLARRLRFAVRGSPLDFYLRLAARAPAPFGVCLSLGDLAVVGTSPELFLQLDRAGRIRTAPIKGTRPRGADAVSDHLLWRELQESAKENAELSMILDVERNDLGRVARPGSVRLTRAPYVETHRTVHHRLGWLEADAVAGVGPLDVLRAMFPSGSVTGAPKIRAMEVIARLEPHRRGLYTGAFGSIAFDGSMCLAMAIRVLTIRDGEAHYFAGGGIVADSDPERELLETRWKGVQLDASS
jgi:para-aminobenzoate synthetase component 1